VKGGNVRTLHVYGFTKGPSWESRIVTNESGDKSQRAKQRSILDFDIETLGTCENADISLAFFLTGTYNFDNEDCGSSAFKKVLWTG
jgi:hypothetical protein